MNANLSWVSAGVIATCLLMMSGLAAFYHQRASTARVQLQRARGDVVELRERLQRQPPNAPDVVLAYNLDVPAAPGESHVVVSPPAEGDPDDRIRTLELEVQEKDRRIAALQADATIRVSSSVTRPDPQAWIEHFKTRDPEGYKAFQKRREEQHQAVTDAFARQAAHLLSNDAADMDEAQQAERQLMLQLVNETWRLAEKIHTEPESGERWTLMRTMRENLDTLSPMLDAERNRVFRQVGLESGYSDADAQIFVDYLNEVIDATSIRPLQRALRRGRPGGGGPPAAVSTPAAMGAAGTQGAGGRQGGL